MEINSQYSEENIRKNCPHCDSKHEAMQDVLEETSNFWIVCDHSPLTVGHILIIPKKHLSCVGEYSKNLMKEFEGLYNKVSKFINSNFGSVSTFEHGIVGQTVFHSHFHLLPFNGPPSKIVPEGDSYLERSGGISSLPDVFEKNGKYLFFSIGKNSWQVSIQLGKPRFFRDRFSLALGNPERGNWKKMAENFALMEQVKLERNKLIQLWKTDFK